MAALLSSNRAMAQQPLHSFFTKPSRAEAPVQAVNAGSENRPKTTPKPATSIRNSSQLGPEPDESDEPQRKRQRTESVEPQVTLLGKEHRPTHGDGTGSNQGADPWDEDTRAGRVRSAEPAELTQESKEPKVKSKSKITPRTPSTNRVLKLRADGKLKSPEKVDTSEHETKPRKRRARARNGKQLTIKYGKTPHLRLSFGRKIDQILAGKLQVGVRQIPAQHLTPDPSSAPSLHAPESAPLATAQDSKTTHPFFLGKVQKPVSVELPGSHSKTPPTTETQGGSIDGQAGKVKKPALPSTFGSSFAKPHKAPGTLPAPWPYHDMQHIRSLGRNYNSVGSASCPRVAERKAKGRQALVALDEEVLASQLSLVRERTRASGGDDKSSSSPERLRKPYRHLISGKDLQVRLKRELEIFHGTEDPNHEPASASALQNVTPATRRLYKMVETSRTAFDRFECDTKDWCHKYAPKRADEVLQNQRDLELLRDWIRARNTDQVDTGSKVGSSRLAAAKELAAKRRKRRIRDELDDFVVPSDEDSDHTDQVSEPEDNTSIEFLASSLSTTSVPALKRLKAGNLDSTRAVLITGPHGCGKTASVYAIAAELGYEIFEINSGTRRNGRDIMERVGDMTRNHLVRNDQPVDVIPEAVDNSDVAIPMDDIVDPKQQSVASFFKSGPKPKVTKKSGASKKLVKEAQNDQPAPKPRRQQKQSLILLEEVDVLFEEDKPFWATVFTLIIQSRRPIIMTCTDTDSLPLGDFVDTTSLGLLPQPRTEVADYLICLAANEGHILARAEALRAIAIRNGDLRAAITDVQFWCQMAIGDDKAGIGWFMEANKANSDRTEFEPLLRSVSERSYPINVSLFKPIRDRACPLENEPKLLAEAFEFNGYDVSEQDAYSASEDHECPENLIDALRLQEIRSDLLSVADVLPMAIREFERTECGSPQLGDKGKGEFADGFHLLQADPVEDFSGVAQDVVFTMKAAMYCADNTIRVKSRRKQLVEAVLQPRSCLYDQQRHNRKRSEAIFETLRDPPDGSPWSLQRGPGISVFGGPFATIATDVAPVLRSIAWSDLRLEDERNRLSRLLIEPGHKNKRQRTTRASRAALEGGNKASTRKERWLPKELDYKAVLKTGGEDWPAPSDEMSVGSVPETGSPSAMASTRASPDESNDELA